MQHHEEELLSPTMKRRPLLAAMGLLPEMKTGRMKTSVILIVLLLVCMVFLGFRYWTVYQLSDRYQRRIFFLERTIYKNARDEDDADVREKDFQRELKRQKEKMVQMSTMMNSEVAKLSSKFQLERENLLKMVESKNAVIKQDGELFSRLKKDYEDLQQHMASFQVNQSRLLEMFTAQSVKVEMLVKLKDACYAQMRSLGRRVSVPAGLDKPIPARESPGEAALAKDHLEVGTPARASPEMLRPDRQRAMIPTPARESPEEGLPARESSGKGVSPRESPAGVAPARQSAVDQKHAAESPELGVPARGSPNTEVSWKESPAGGTQGRQSAMVESPAQETPKEGVPALERPKEELPARERPEEELPARESQLPASQEELAEGREAEADADAAPAPALEPAGSRDAAKKPEGVPSHPGQSSVNENAIKKDVEAAPAPAPVPSNSRVSVSLPQLGKEHKDLPPEPGLSPMEKIDIEVQKEKKAASDASRVNDKEDRLPFMKKDEKVPAGGAVNAPGSKIQPDSQPKEKQNNAEMEAEEEEAPDYSP